MQPEIHARDSFGRQPTIDQGSIYCSSGDVHLELSWVCLVVLGGSKTCTKKLPGGYHENVRDIHHIEVQVLKRKGIPLLLGEDRVDRMKIDEDRVWRCRSVTRWR
jgi:hypothetical protein